MALDYFNAFCEKQKLQPSEIFTPKFLALPVKKRVKLLKDLQAKLDVLGEKVSLLEVKFIFGQARMAPEDIQAYWKIAGQLDAFTAQAQKIMGPSYLHSQAHHVPSSLVSEWHGLAHDLWHIARYQKIPKQSSRSPFNELYNMQRFGRPDHP